MRWDHITRLRAPMLAVLMLLCALVLIAWAQAEAAPLAPLLPPAAQTSEEWWRDDSVAESLGSEALLLLVCILECGLLVGGLEAFDLWRERARTKKEEERITHPRTQIGTV